jgi:hypothetical protein
MSSSSAVRADRVARRRRRPVHALPADGHLAGEIDATYGHLAPDADERERALLDAYDLGAAAEGATAR